MTINQTFFLAAFAATLAACTPKAAPTAAVTTKPTEKPKMEENKTLPAPEWAKNCVIYEVNVRQFSKEGNFKAVETQIPRLKNMGVDVLWFMPIQPIGVKGRKGTLGSYYSISDYTGINPEFGTLADFKALCDAAHKNGMKVMIDWVANHTSFDNVWIDKHPEWYTQKDGKIIPPVDDWTDVADLNYDNKFMRKAQVDALKYWIKECKLDGYRCDVAMMVPLEFWDVDVRPTLDKEANLLWLAEAEGPEFHKKAFHITYGWEWHHLYNGIAQGKKKVSDLDALIKAESEKYGADEMRLQFTSNHDENSWNGTETERMGRGAQTFAVLSTMLPGVPLIYNGQEAPLQRRLKFFEKDPIGWNKYAFAGFYKKMYDLKHRNKALWNGSHGGKLEKLATNHDDAAFAFTREKDGDKIITICNLSATDLDVNINDARLKGDYTEIFTNQKRTLKDKEQFTLKAWSYVVLSNK
jgi:1,4-alpha-glucan branching enzyme